MTKAKIDRIKDFHPLKRSEWRDWLQENHQKSDGIWFVYYKKASGKTRVSYDAAVEEALCFGWIDSVPRKIDKQRSKLLFTPRKSKSVWSKINKERIEKLIESGQMTAAGLAKIVKAKKDGSWNALDASDNLEIQPDLAKAFKQNAEANKNFDNFPKSAKKAILAWIYLAKSPNTRSRRIEKTIRMAEKNLRANFDKEI